MVIILTVLTQLTMMKVTRNLPLQCLHNKGEDTFRYCEEQFEENIDASFMAKLIMLIQHAALKVQEEKKQPTLDTFLK